MVSNLLGEHPVDTLTAVFERATDELLVVNPPTGFLEDLIAVAKDATDLPRIRVLGDESAMKAVMGDFIVASAAADLIDADVLELRAIEDASSNSLVVSSDMVVAIVSAGEQTAGLSTDDDGFVAAANDEYGAQWDSAEPFTLRTPAISRVHETLADEIGETAQADFEAILASLETARGDGAGLDEVTISLLVAAKNDVLLYDISKWGEDVGIASKATFSRTKTHLEDTGLIDTEKVPIDVGRPRLRLKLSNDRLVAASNEDIAAVAMDLLSS